MDITSYMLGKKNGGVTPTGEVDINSNGVHNVSGYATADVNVAPNLQSKTQTITTNGTTTITNDSGYEGLSSVEVITNVDADLSDYYNYSLLSSNGTISAINRSIKKIPAGMVCPTYMSYGFYGCSSLTEIPQIDTSNVLSMANMFEKCSSLTEISQLNTSKVTNMSSMFYGCSHLITIPLLDTSSVITMFAMFQDCTRLTSIPQLDTSSVTNIYSMFEKCSSLTEIPLLNTSKVTNMSRAFAFCTNLTTVPLLDTSKATNMQDMFGSCNNLSDTSLNNILEMCINATNYTGTKTFAYVKGTNTTFYPASRIQALPSYNDFIAAGWTIGYS